MKKITLLLFAICIGLTGYAQLSEDFEGETFPPAGWTSFIGTNGLGTVQNWQGAYYAGSGAALCFYETLSPGERSEDWLVTSQFTVDSTAPYLYFDSIDSGTTEYGSIFTVRVSTASQTTHSDFTIVDSQDESEITHSQTSFMGSTREIDLSAYVGQEIYIAFVLEQNDGDLWAIDNVQMSEFIAPPSVAPLAAVNPDPADESTVFLSEGIDQDGGVINQYIFTWELPSESEVADTYTFDLGVDPTVDLFTTTLSGPTLTLQGLDPSSTYFWRVTSVNVIGETVGTVWSFTTEATVLSNDSFEAEKVLNYFVSNDNLNIKASKNLNQVEIYNMVGQVVSTTKLNNDSAEISLSNLSSGMYIATVSIEGKTQTFKFVK